MRDAKNIAQSLRNLADRLDSQPGPRFITGIVYCIAAANMLEKQDGEIRELKTMIADMRIRLWTGVIY